MPQSTTPPTGGLTLNSATVIGWNVINTGILLLVRQLCAAIVALALPRLLSG